VNGLGGPGGLEERRQRVSRWSSDNAFVGFRGFLARVEGKGVGGNSSYNILIL